MTKQIIPIFYACDDNFVKYTAVSLRSMIDNADKKRKYRVYILNTHISEDNQKVILDMQNSSFEISFVNVSDYLSKINGALPLRDYYSKTTYFRLFIPDMFPAYDKCIYIDSDTVVKGDISKLHDIDIGDRMIGACHEEAMRQIDVFGRYCEKVVGISRHNFFNAGMIVMNCRVFRDTFALSRFGKLLSEYEFRVTQDEDYLNVMCKDNVHWLDSKWNTELIGELACPIEKSAVIHYMMVKKPWRYPDCRGGEIFWHYAKKTAFYSDILDECNRYTEQERKRDENSAAKLEELAESEILREDNYLNRIRSKRDANRVKVEEKIAVFEREGRFTEDVEDDPPSRTLMPGEVDYLRKKLSSRIRQKKAYRMAKVFLNKIIKNGILRVKEIKGLENLKNLNSGAVITCNHFNALDSFAMHVLYLESGHKKRKLYRVIREGNYTSFPGFYGYLMRNFYTLPLSSNVRTMTEFLKATSTLLSEGNFVLVYPEQSMWWNYRKPKPLQPGAYRIAAKNGVPVLPVFITMQDSLTVGDDGYPVQEYTLNVGAPIYPDKDKTTSENIDMMMEKNAELWKNTYEDFYGMPLIYC